MESRNYLFKVLVIGGGYVGKTSLVHREFWGPPPVASGCITDASSFHSVRNWKEDLDSKITLESGALLPCILLANKCDLSPWDVPLSTIEKFSEANGFIRWMETSVKDNKNINESINFLVDRMLAVERESRQELDRGQIKLDDPGKKPKGCC